MIRWLALDIGGAHLKMSDGKSFAESREFSLWETPELLSQKLRTFIAEAPDAGHLAVTMTGELADCFETKEEGVRFILNALTEAADARHTRVYRNDGRLVSNTVALTQPLMAAASNWHALARFAGRYAKEGTAILIDIGSTTTDIVPLVDGQPAPSATTDTERLIQGEMVYTGVERTPLCGVLKTIPYHGQECPMATELFATTLDAYLILGDLMEDRIVRFAPQTVGRRQSSTRWKDSPAASVRIGQPSMTTMPRRCPKRWPRRRRLQLARP